MDDELDTFGCGNSDLEESPDCVGSHEHDEIIEVEHTDWVSVGVQHVVVEDTVPAGARQDHGIHIIKLA